MDFVSDQLYNGKRFRTLTVLDLYSRECLDIYADKSIKGEIMTEVLDRLIDYVDYYNNQRSKVKLKGLLPALHRQPALAVA